MLISIISIFALTGCSSVANKIHKASAGLTSSDYVIVKYSMNAEPYRYWIVRSDFVSNEENSDGYYWSDSNGGIDRVVDADAYDVHGLSDKEIVKKYHLENALKIEN